MKIRLLITVPGTSVHTTWYTSVLLIHTSTFNNSGDVLTDYDFYLDIQNHFPNTRHVMLKFILANKIAGTSSMQQKYLLVIT